MRMFQVVRKRSGIKRRSIVRKRVNFGVVAAALAFAFLAASCGHCPSTPIPGPRPLPSPVQFGAATVNNGGPYFKATWGAGVDMSSALTGDGFHIGKWLNVGVHVEWPSTGSPVGTFKFQASADSLTGLDGRWRDITLTVDTQPSGTANGDLIDFSGMQWEWIRCVYTPTSGGVGALPDIYYFGKGPAN